MRRFTAATALIAGLVAATPAPGAPAEDGGVTAQIRGAVSLGRNRPVVGASILVRPEDRGSPIHLTATDARGFYRIEGLDAGSYRVEVRRDGFHPVIQRNVAVRPPFRAVVEVRMEPAGSEPDPAAIPSSSKPGGEVSLEGRVADPEGEGARDVRVRLFSEGGGADPRSVRTGDDGAFSVEGVPVGRWRIEVLGPGYLPIRMPLEVREGSTAFITLARQPANYSPGPLDLMPEERPIPPPEK